MSSCRKRENIVKISFRTGYRETSTRAFIGREGRFRFPFYPPSANKTRTSHERNLGSSLGFIKFQNSDPLCPVNFAILQVSPCKNRGKRVLVETRNFWNSTTPRWFLFSLSLSSSFVRLRTTYKKGGKKIVSTIPPKVFDKIFFSTRRMLGFPRRSKGIREKETGRRPVQVHPTDLNSYFSNHANVEIRILGGCLELFFSPGSRLIFLLSIFD